MRDLLACCLLYINPGPLIHFMRDSRLQIESMAMAILLLSIDGFIINFSEMIARFGYLRT